MRKTFMLLILAVVLGTFTITSNLQAAPKFSTKPITVICPWAAGGGTDTILRSLCKETEKISWTTCKRFQSNRWRWSNRTCCYHECKT